jgi:L-alanine-DL-glutamate epimerase-like enolase superfamily enzyme
LDIPYAVPFPVARGSESVSLLANNQLLSPPLSAYLAAVQLNYWQGQLRLKRAWVISRGRDSTDELATRVIFVRLSDADGAWGLGEAAPSGRYEETPASVQAFLSRVEARQLSCCDIPASMAYLDSLAPGNHAAKAAVNIALVDAAARRTGQAVCQWLNLGFTEGKHVTSFSIGLDEPEVIRQKVREAEEYPVLKLKVGSAGDGENLLALRDVAPAKPVRVDANEAWKTKEEALSHLEWLARDGHIEFIEQPMPADTPAQEWRWLRERSPLPIMADESYHSAADAERCAECFHAVNVKLVKTGGISGAYEALRTARRLGLKTMIGCMIESSVLITAAAHLAELADFLDLDGNLLITNDPYSGATAERGIISFANAPEPVGLRVAPRASGRCSGRDQMTGLRVP